MKIRVAATFTAEPLLDSLAFWNEKLEWHADIEFAPYHQVFQQLLDPASLLSRNDNGVNVVLARSEDWLRYQGKGEGEKDQKRLTESTNQFAEAMETAIRSSRTPYIVILCPASPGVLHDPAYQAIEDAIYVRLQNQAGLTVVSSREAMAAYPVPQYYDADSDEIGHIPYTAEFFAGLGTLVARKIHALAAAPYKVIVADCDETLWKGVCGELGARGIEIDPGRRQLQEFLLRQQQAGMLLCLCSKNNAEDVEEVFRWRDDMVVRREHFVAARINWQAKADNLLELARELGLGLDSFIFIDDNPLECAQVKASCPEVLTLSLPTSSESIAHFLANVWAFDKRRVTEEDRKRAAFYSANRERERFRQQVPTLESFLSGLQLKVDLSELNPEEVARVAQLTERTNQFNTTTLRRSEDQIRWAIQSGELECTTVRVSDRFGDYGLVGAMMYRATGEALEVDSFLLSCRVLGRGVEHRMLRRLGQLAKDRDLARVDIRFASSKKNRPAWSFLEEVTGPYREKAGEGFCFRIPAAYACGLSEVRIVEPSQVAADSVQENQDRHSRSAVAARSELLEEIATQLADTRCVLEAIRRQKGILAPEAAEARLSSEEKAVVEVWSEVLGGAQLGPADDFFALGGDSLLATQVISRLRQACGVRLHLRDLFENTTVSLLAEAIRKARQDKRSSRPSSPTAEARETAPERLVRQQLEAIPRRPELSPCSLSFAQQRWWFLNQWAPGTADHLSLVLRLRGELDCTSLQDALYGLAKRHEILRTRYSLSEGSPVQIIADHPTARLHTIDLRLSSPADREREAEKIIEQQFREPFDLSAGPPLRSTLLQLASDDHVLVLAAHHIASDGWSRGIFLRELEALYTALVSHQEPNLPGLTLQYADYALWQRQRMAEGALEEQLSFWKRQLAGAPSILELPTDYPRPSVQDLREGVHVRMISNELVERLSKLSQREGTTLFMTLLAAYLVLLYRYSGQPDLVVGSPVAGRNHPNLEGLIGCFINMLVFRNRIEGDQSFRQLLARVREVTLAAQDNQDVPFERLVEELEHGRDLSRAPIFQVVFALENPLSAPNFPKLQVGLREEETRTAFHDLSLFVAAREEGLRVRFEYRRDLFEPTTIERVAEHFENLLASIAADPDQTPASLAMLSESERRQLVYGWNPARRYPVAQCIHQRFEHQVERAPGNVAVICDGSQLSYGQLNARANQLARYLIRMGVGPEVVVGLAMERSLDLVVAILGILKAGGAYLPLDPRYPKDRLAFMVADAEPPVVVTQYELKERLPEIAGQVLALDADWAEIDREDSKNLACSAGPENLAYVIYTSGSSGRPKGCQVTHANVGRLFDATQDWFGFEQRDAWTLFHSYAFDFSVWELWGALFYGGRIVVVPYWVSRSPEEFYRLLESERITVLNQTPSSFRQLMHAEESLGAGDRLSLRYIIFGGEALEIESLRPWFDRHGDQSPRMINMYGITETTVHVTYRPLSIQDLSAGSVIGCPIPDLQVYLLDRNLEPTPIGVPGEIYVGGAGVARGYLKRPELTAERFLADKFRPDSGHQLYRSGDLGRRLPSGDIEYLGRIDQQVKIRGFRVELGEIEAVLGRHPSVREAVVIISSAGDRSEEKRLIAYIVPQDGQNASGSELHRFLKEWLPEYMIPVAFVQLDRMPLTANGKVDRRALPQPDLGRPERDGAFIAPRTPLEEEVAVAWKEVLGAQQIGVNDNFFEIGGHSLLATRVIMLLRSRLGLTFSLRLLFENPTVAGMASGLMEALVEQTQEPDLVEMVSAVEGLSDEDARVLREGIGSVPEARDALTDSRS